ncbi:replication initiator protein A [Streptococcus canis]|uniref:replication initiator protein A n=1 Tax=Streptococcus canis TaxID=1329 RepID=UPI002948E18D|nr:replication initiator protein A [Streptococcus canis]MDV6000865.1 replication initiator protein A [Streptococcus canis]
MKLEEFNAITIEQMETSEIDIRIPKVLFEDSHYEKLRLDAKVLYGLLKDRLRLSAKNSWIDDMGRVYLEYTNGELTRILGCSKPTVIKAKQALVEYGLIFEQSQFTNADGQVANRIYLGNVLTYNSEKYKKERQKRQHEAFMKRQNNLNTPRKKFLLGEEKDLTGAVKKVDTNKNDTRKIYSSITNSSRKAEKISEEISSPPETDSTPIQNQSLPFIKPQYYSLLQVIADRYNDRLFCFPDVVTLTHQQKMKVGEYLETGYVISDEVLSIIDRIPDDCKSPLAYLYKSLENLKEERRLEAKLLAHKQAEQRYG